MNVQHDPCPAEDLQISSISDREWRVADGRLSDQSPQKVLGFIQRHPSGFEVLDIISPDRDLFFTDWKAAVEFFAAEPGVLDGSR
jgi:hypothetical protein